jgi:hypothetical protein
LGCVNRIGYYFPQENVMLGIEELFDDGEQIFTGNPDFSCRYFLPNKLNIV